MKLLCVSGEVNLSEKGAFDLLNDAQCSLERSKPPFTLCAPKTSLSHFLDFVHAMDKRLKATSGHSAVLSVLADYYPRIVMYNNYCPTRMFIQNAALCISLHY